jgi:cytochrome c-type biogenesis protein CcmE
VKAKYIIGAVIIVAFAIWGMSSFLNQTIKYVSIKDVPGTTRTVQVMGKIDFDTVVFDTDSAHLVFEITDLEHNDADTRLKVVYSGMVPGNFDQATSVVAKGKYINGALVADQLLIKCPSKYQGLEGKA